jgi:1-acyl-sn-glycerol-3-phosphate acyltransferase
VTALFTALRFACWTAALLPLQMILVRLNLPLAKRIPMIYHRGVSRIIAFKIERHGEMSHTRPTLFVCNHSSYLDITMYGAVLPGSFVAKLEVRSWPLFGLLARLQRTVFVERRAVRTAAHRDEMQQRLERGDNLILFPEGTSNDGNRVLPFKSAFFSVAEKEINDQPITVQPVSICYTRLDGIPIGRGNRPIFAWYGDMEMASHLWNVFGLGQTTVAIEFHEPVTMADFKSRKEMSAHCHRVISEGVSRGIHGHLGKPAKHAWRASKPA